MENEKPADIQTEEKTPVPEAQPADAAPPAAEEPILLSKIFPDAKQDLDALFPEPEMKRLLKDVVRSRQKNERFLKRITLPELPSEDEDEGGGPADPSA